MGYPTYSPGAETLLEDEMTKLYNEGYIWKDDYTQCILQTALAAIKYQIEYDPGLCNAINEDDDLQNDEETIEDEKTNQTPENYLIMTDPILLNTEEKTDPEQFYYVEDDNEDDTPKTYLEITKKNIPELLDISTRDLEEPYELTGIEHLPIQLTKFYQPRPASNYEATDYNDEELDDYIDPTLFDYASDDDENIFNDQEENSNDDEIGSMLFNRRERMDVKKPGPFFEASPNNFYLDKLSENYDLKDEENNDNNNETKSEDPGQQEYEIPMSTSKEKRMDPEIPEIEDEQLNNYVHIALNKKLQHWKDGADFINNLEELLGLPENTLTDRTFEDQHVQFKVEPNDLDIDAEQVAQALENDISIQKRLSGDHDVDIAKAASGKRADRASVFPHGRNLNLLILTVVGASATASLLVGGLIFFLAKRSRAARKISKLQLSDDVEDRGKLQEEYKQLCRDWSKTSQPASMENVKNNKPVTTSISKLQTQESNGSNGSIGNGSNRSSTSSWTDEPANNSMDISTGHMVLAYMEDHLKNKQRLEQEWVGLCGYEAEPSSTIVAFKAENKKKNRYPDKLPYDHNRVILNALVNATNSDYINASTVTDHDPRNPSFIVTQGPLGQTVADFWQMVWEQGCVVIVMLTRLQDNGYQLCTRYWPEEGSEQYHIFEVHLVSEHVWCEDYLVRSVYLKNTRTGETRTVTQFHFRSWPAHGVPSSTKALLEFRRKVNKSYRGRSCPIVVHCSDGVGRAGTYVLIDMVLNRLSKGCKEIDIAATLEHIRDQRGGMVQNRQQFEFCLMAVAEEVYVILKALPTQQQ